MFIVYEKTFFLSLLSALNPCSPALSFHTIISCAHVRKYRNTRIRSFAIRHSFAPGNLRIEYYYRYLKFYEPMQYFRSTNYHDN